MAMNPQMPHPAMQQQQEQLQMQAMKEQIATSIHASDARYHPVETSRRINSGLFGGAFRAALIFGTIAAVVAFGLAAGGIIGGAAAGATIGAKIASAAYMIAGIIGGTAIGMGTIVGVRNAARENGAARGYNEGRYVGQMETGLVVSEVAEQFGKVLEQEKAKCTQKAAPEKKGLDFSHLPNHPHTQPKTVRAQQGTHTQNIMSEPAINAALGQAK